MSEVCYWIEDPEMGPIHIPGCWGAVHAGPSGCICEGVPDDPKYPAYALADAEARIDELQARIRALEAEVDLARREGFTAGIDAAAALAARDTDWTRFARQQRTDWTGEAKNALAWLPADDEDHSPTQANVRAYQHGILIGAVIAAAIRRLRLAKP